MLTAYQQRHWDTFGFVTFHDLFSQIEVDIIQDEFELGLKSEQANYPDGELPRHFTGLGSETPFFRSLPEDPRFLEAAEQMFGNDVVSVGSNGQRFTTDKTRWHPDLIKGTSETKNNHIEGVKFACYLEPLGINNGSLRLIPGSHLSPFHDELFAIGLKGNDSEFLKGTGLSVGDIPAYVWTSQPTDVIAFNNRTWHASWGGSGDRRQINVMYYKNPHNVREEGLAYEISRQEKILRIDDDRRGLMYPYSWLANPDNDPKRQHWIDWLGKYGYLT